MRVVLYINLCPLSYPVESLDTFRACLRSSRTCFKLSIYKKKLNTNVDQCKFTGSVAKCGKTAVNNFFN